MKLLAAVLMMLTLCPARQVDIAWDAAPVSEQVVGWRIYNGGTLISASNVPSATLTLTNDEAVLTVTAVNAIGESAPSEPLTIPLPNATVQRSADLVNWTTLTTIPARNHPQLRVRIVSPTTVALEQTYDAAPDWELIVSLPYNPPEFFRLQLPPE